jgi:anti-anti-sigma factor
VPDIPPQLLIQQSGDVTVVRLPQPVVLPGETADGVGRQLEGVVQDAGRSLLLFDLGNLVSLTSLMIGRLIGLSKRLAAAGGRLVLCAPRPDVRELLEVVRVPRLIAIYPSEREALRSMAAAATGAPPS